MLSSQHREQDKQKQQSKLDASEEYPEVQGSYSGLMVRLYQLRVVSVD
jgi:hypothetical protein